jgi:hypothetical protein
MAIRGAGRGEQVIRGTGNVFADLGFPDAAERQVKLRLAYALNQVQSAQALAGGRRRGTWSDVAEGLRPPSLQGWRVLRREPDEPPHGARSSRRDRDSAKAPLQKACADQRRCDLSLAAAGSRPFDNPPG